MTLAELLAQVLPIGEAPARRLTKRLGAALRREVLEGRRVAWPHVGVFILRHRKARVLRHPGTGELLRVQGDERVGFRPSVAAKRGVA